MTDYPIPPKWMPAESETVIRIPVGPEREVNEFWISVYNRMLALEEKVARIETRVEYIRNPRGGKPQDNHTPKA